MNLPSLFKRSNWLSPFRNRKPRPVRRRENRRRLGMLGLEDRVTPSSGTVSLAGPGGVLNVQSESSMWTSTFNEWGSRQISDDGRWTVFLSEANNLVPGQVANPGSDVFLFDRVSGTTTLVSRAAGTTATEGNNYSFEATISADGAFVAYTSYADNLVAGYSKASYLGMEDVYLFDVAAGTTTLVSRNSTSATTGGDSWSLFPSISGDGRFVAFQSLATDLVPGQTGAYQENVFVYDRVAGTTALVSRNSTSPTETSNGGGYLPQISSNGAFVVFVSGSTDLVAGQTGGVGLQTFVFDRAAGTNTLVSRSSASATTGGNAASDHFSSISADGAFIAFSSRASNLAPGQTDTNNDYDVFLFDRVAGTTTLVSRNSNSPTTAGNAQSYGWKLSADGSAIAFRSLATDLIPGQTDLNGGNDVFVFDRLAGTTTLVSRSSDWPTTTGNAQSSGGGIVPTISGDGRFVSFQSAAFDLVMGQSVPGGVFVFDRVAGTTMRASAGTMPQISGDGKFIAFQGGGVSLYHVPNPPVIDAGGPHTIDEGDSLTLQASAVFDPQPGEIFTYSWDVNGDLEFGDAFGENPTLTWAELVALNISDGPNNYTPTVRVDNGLGQVGFGQTELTVQNVPPTVEIAGANEGITSQLFTFSLTAIDFSPIDLQSAFDYSIEWGDGSEFLSTGLSDHLVSHAFTSPGEYIVRVAARDTDWVAGFGNFAEFSVTVSELTSENLEAQLPASGGIFETQATTQQVIEDLVAAVNALPSPSEPVEVIVDLAGNDFVGVTASPPPNVTLTFTNGTFNGASPALTVTQGIVVVLDSILTNNTDAATILVTGGHLMVRGSIVQESTGYDQFAIEVLGGTVDLGTTSNPGGNVVNVNGPGSFIRNLTGNAIPTEGTEFTTSSNFSTIQGLVWVDFNNDGEVNFGEHVIEGVTINLTGFDDLGNWVQRTAQTDANGIYSFTDLRPSNAAGYTLTQLQPAGFMDGRDTLGLVDGIAAGNDPVNDTFSGIVLSPTGSLAENYNFGERPASGGSVGTGQTATIGFWQNKHGQNLIKALNGGQFATELGNWLASTFPNMYAALDGLSNAQVAAHYKTLFGRNGQSSPGGPPKVDAQVMATALAVYVTNESLAGNTASSYGFQVGQYGVGAATFNVGSNGAAFSVANGTSLSVMDLLLAVNNRSHNGLLFDQNGDGVISAQEANLRTMANNVFSLINESGDI